jgi:hypothetical protein
MYDKHSLIYMYLFHNVSFKYDMIYLYCITICETALDICKVQSKDLSTKWIAAHAIRQRQRFNRLFILYTVGRKTLYPVMNEIRIYTLL